MTKKELKKRAKKGNPTAMRLLIEKGELLLVEQRPGDRLVAKWANRKRDNYALDYVISHAENLDRAIRYYGEEIIEHYGGPFRKCDWCKRKKPENNDDPRWEGLHRIIGERRDEANGAFIGHEWLLYAICPDCTPQYKQYRLAARKLVYQTSLAFWEVPRRLVEIYILNKALKREARRLYGKEQNGNAQGDSD